MKSNTWRKKVAIGTGCAALLIGSALGYREVFLQGIESLPTRPCDGTVERSTAAAILPAAREVQENKRETAPGKDFREHCILTTSGDSILSAVAESHDSTVATYRQFNRESLGPYVSLPGRWQILSWPTETKLYLPCTPPGADSEDAVQAFALIIDAKIVGDSRLSGNELRQRLSDFAVEAARHAQRAAQCQERTELPSTAPRLPAG